MCVGSSQPPTADHHLSARSGRAAPHQAIMACRALPFPPCTVCSILTWHMPFSKRARRESWPAWKGNRVTVAVDANPTVARRQLAVFLKRLREQRKRSLDEVAKHLGVAVSQASRLDTGARGYSPDDVGSLASWYGLSETDEASLLALAEESRKRAWWQQVDLMPSYRTLIGMEQAAESINEYTSSVIPGLLQTRDYAQAMIRASELDIRPDRVEQAVAVRMRRQQVLTRERAPQLWVVIDEAVLARVTGGIECHARPAGTPARCCGQPRCHHSGRGIRVWNSSGCRASICSPGHAGRAARRSVHRESPRPPPTRAMIACSSDIAVCGRC